MKKLLTLAGAMAVCLSSCATQSTVQTPATDNPLGGIGKLLGGNGSGNSSASSITDALGGIVSGLLTNDKIEPKRLTGTWKYAGPAVCFKSENFLQKAGGSAMAGTIEGKLAPYYQKAGLQNMVLTVDDEQNFTMQSGMMKATGTITIDGTDVYFNFTALGKIKLGKVKTYVTMTGNSKMSIMFDVSKLLAVVNAVGSKVGSGTISSITKLLGSYDGLCAGFKLTKAN